MKKILFSFVIWRVFITIAMIFGLVLPVKMSFLGGSAEYYFDNPLVWSWANFDGVHYLGIAREGYKLFEQAFFPLYPLLIRIIGAYSGWDYVKIGLLISNISFCLTLIVLYSLVKLDDVKNALWIVLFFLFFPTTFYFAGVYTEAFFLLLVIVAFYAARQKMWWLAGICGALASATRLAGVFLFPALLVEYILTQKHSLLCHSRANGNLYNNYCIDPRVPYRVNKSEDDKKYSRGMNLSVIWLFLIPLGLFIYMFWLNQNYGDPLYFFHVQSAYGAGRTNSSIILLPQVIFRYLKILITASFSYQYLISLFEFLTSMGIMGLLIYGINKMRPSYWIFTFLCFIVPTLTGTFLSMPRFAITMFPLFILLPSILETARKRMFVLGVFLVILFVATMLYTRGYWIA